MALNPLLRFPRLHGRRRRTVLAAVRVGLVAVALLPLLGAGATPSHGPLIPPTGDHLSAPLSGWRPAGPLASPAVELERLLETRAPETRHGPSGPGPAGPSEGVLRARFAALSLPLPVHAPRRPAGSFQPHRANAPPSAA